ncbi:MAG TPA: hypothetical protein VFG35_14185 [Actinoplanes sp.]|nr:hypothetical protein [Actinoplanes sp.]
MSIGNNVTQAILCGAFSVLCAYAAGRVHQWYRYSMDRDRSFREGYNDGYYALFPLAARERRSPSDVTGLAEPGPLTGSETRRGSRAFDR